MTEFLVRPETFGATVYDPRGLSYFFVNTVQFAVLQPYLSVTWEKSASMASMLRTGTEADISRGNFAQLQTALSNGSTLRARPAPPPLPADSFIRLKTEFVYLAVIMDVYTRSIRGWYLSRTLDQDLTLTALKRALAHRTPEIHHSDQGVHAATAYTDLLQARGVAISMAEVGESTQNGYAERLIRTIKEEEVDLSDYLDFADAYHQIGRFLEDVYMHKRIHSSLGYLTPVEFENQWSAQQTAGTTVD
jgi:transposase InsO family protein